ncbi:MAG: aminotransferase class V-fold PLP-dependent enzyme, partial [Pontimonas sp.]
QFYRSDPLLCYLDGNSLGRLPLATIDSVNSFLTEQWGSELVSGWSNWIDQSERAGDQLARAVLGTGPGQTLVTDSASVNLYQLLVAAIDAQPSRRTVIIDSANFPTDRYILQGIARARGLELITLDVDQTGGPGAVHLETDREQLDPALLEPLLNEDVAVLTLQAVNYRTGTRQPVREITELARKYGIPVVWDCSHAAGSVVLDFDANGVDLAVGCTYKYLNAGPGSPGWLFVATRWQKRLQVPIQGWFAQADQFAMGPEFDPVEGIGRFQIGSPPIMGIRCVQSSLEMIERAGIAAIADKAQRGTDLMIELFDAWLAPLGFELHSPRRAEHRGGHITVTHPEAKQIALAMRQLENVIPDYREPSTIRLAMSPLATTYQEVWDGFDRMRQLVESGRYREATAETSRVT